MNAALQGPGGRIALGPAQLTIGRTPDNQLVIADPKASSRHATINWSPQGYSVTDLGSTNGTFVNEQRLEPHVPRLLYSGERIRFGDTTYTYDGGGPAVPDHSPTLAANPYEYTAYGGASQPTPPSGPNYQANPQPAYPPALPTAYAAPQGNAAINQVAYPPPPSPYGQPAFTPIPPGVPNYPPSPSYAPVPSAPRSSGKGLKIVIIVLVAILVIGGGASAFAIYAFTRPQPTISMTSKFNVAGANAGASGTTLHVTGSKFSANSAITFLLDGNVVSGGPSVQSDANGNITADLTISNAWSVGTHILTAKDGSGYTTKVGAAVTIVTPGQAHTPGPNGAPSDDASFTVNVTIQRHNATTGENLKVITETLTVTGKADGGTVCSSFDNGQPHTSTGTTSAGVNYTENLSATCTGSYKGGKFSYTETLTADKIVYADGVTCNAQTPVTFEKLTGSFTSANAVNGDYSADKVPFTCTDGNSDLPAEQGTWTGTASISGGTPS